MLLKAIKRELRFKKKAKNEDFPKNISTKIFKIDERLFLLIFALCNAIDRRMCEVYVTKGEVTSELSLVLSKLSFCLVTVLIE